MNWRKISGIILFVAGICLYLFGSYVSNQVDEGRQKIRKAQTSVDFTKNVTDGNKYSKEVGDLFRQPVQKKIDEGRETADSYSTLALWLHISGIIVFVVGILLFALGFVKRKRS